jgi:hypothetical protein
MPLNVLGARPVPRPLAAGVGLAASLPAIMASLPGRLPALAVAAAGRLQSEYEELARTGAALLGQPSTDGSEAWTGGDWQGEDLDEISFEVESASEPGSGPGSEAGAEPGSVAAETTAAAEGITAAAQDRRHQVAHPPLAQNLPVADYDHLSLAQLRARMTRLDAAELGTLRDYESAHGRRLPVLTMLENRLAKLAASA